MNCKVMSHKALPGLLLLGLLCVSRPVMAAPETPVTSRIKPLSGGVSQEAFALSNDIELAELQVKQNPNDAEAHFLMAVAYSRTPYVEKALEELVQARKLARKSKDGFAVFDRKIAEYEKMLAKNPDDPLVLYRLGFGYYIRGYAVDYGYIKDKKANPDKFYDKAEQAFQHLIRIDPTDFSARNYLGYLLAERSPKANYDAAVNLWRESLAISEENPGAYMLLGQAALQKGDLRHAVSYSTKALKARNQWLIRHGIDPDTVEVHL